MYLTTEKKEEFFAQFGKSAKDTGSSEGQVALHHYLQNKTVLKKNRKDYSTQRALQLLVGKRRNILDYLKKKDIERYRAIIKALGLRK
jgi:small subunit ribosomal protein S15